jgi:hypothetical protein
MEFSNWPLFIQRRHALGKITLGPKPTAQYKATPASETLSAKEALESFYAVLTTLDSKASALMRLNGVVIAAAAFLLGLFGRQGSTILSTQSYDASLVIGCALLSAISITCCLLVVNVSWPFLGKVERSSDDTFDCGKEILALEKARAFRERVYRFAWLLSLVASALFLFEFLIQAWHVL